MKRLQREAGADVMIEDYVPGSQERVMTVALHRESPQHSATAGGDALVAVFDNLCEVYRDTLPGTSSDDLDHHQAVSSGAADADEDASMNGNGMSHDGETHDVRLLLDSSREWKPLENWRCCCRRL